MQSQIPASKGLIDTVFADLCLEDAKMYTCGQGYEILAAAQREPLEGLAAPNCCETKVNKVHATYLLRTAVLREQISPFVSSLIPDPPMFKSSMFFKLSIILPMMSDMFKLQRKRQRRLMFSPQRPERAENRWVFRERLVKFGGM